MASENQQVTLRLSKDTIYRLAMEAHENAVTLEAYIQRILHQRLGEKSEKVPA